MLNKYLFLTSKPMIYLINLSEKDYIRKKNKWWVFWSLIIISKGTLVLVNIDIIVFYSLLNAIFGNIPYLMEYSRNENFTKLNQFSSIFFLAWLFIYILVIKPLVAFQNPALFLDSYLLSTGIFHVLCPVQGINFHNTDNRCLSSSVWIKIQSQNKMIY